MRWWPVRGKRRGRAAPESELAAPESGRTVATVTTEPSTLQAPITPPTPHVESQSFQRPDNVFGLLSDLTRFPRQCLMFIVLVGSILVIGAVCVVVVMAATKGLKINPLPATIVGLFGASSLSVLGSLIRWWIKKPGQGGDRG